MPCYVLRMRREFGFAPGHAVEADRVEKTPETIQFWRDGGLVYTVPAKLVAAIDTYPDRSSAIEALREVVRAGMPGKGAIGGEAVARRRAGGQKAAVIEGVRIVVEGRKT